MANVQSAVKKNRQRLRHRQRNLAQLTKVRSYVKRVHAALAAKDAKAEEQLKVAVRALDKAAQKGVIKRQTASRSISRLTRSLKAATQPAGAR